MSKVRTPEPEMFDDFWAVWRPHMRHTDGRGDARERYRKLLLDGAEPAEILLGAQEYIAHLKSLPERERGFIPLAASWLNKWAFQDWADRARDREQLVAERATHASVVQFQPRKKTAFLEQWEREQQRKEG